MVYQTRFWILSLISLVSENNRSFLTSKSPLGLGLKQPCLRAPSSILWLLLFLIYINDLSDNLLTTAKLSANNTSLFSIVQNVNTSASHLNSDLSQLGKLAFQWKMIFNPDPSKQAQEVIFSCRLQKTCHPSICFNNKSVKQVPSEKHLWMILDTRLNFQKILKIY